MTACHPLGVVMSFTRSACGQHLAGRQYPVKSAAFPSQLGSSGPGCACAANFDLRAPSTSLQNYLQNAGGPVWPLPHSPSLYQATFWGWSPLSLSDGPPPGLSLWQSSPWSFVMGTPSSLGSSPLPEEQGVCREVDSWHLGSTYLTLELEQGTACFCFHERGRTAGHR